MTETVTARFGGEDIVLPMILNLSTLKRAWPALLAWDGASDPIAKSLSAVAFVAAILAKTRPDLTPTLLEDRLLVARYKPGTDDAVEYDERANLNQAVRRIAVESGLIPLSPPESPAAESPSMATGST